MPPPRVAFPFAALLTQVGRALVLGEAALYPDLARLGGHPERLTERLADTLKYVLEGEGPAKWYPRRLARADRVSRGSVSIEVSPPRAAVGWETPVRLVLPTLEWDHDGRYRVARVPALGIEILIPSKLTAEEADKLREREAREALTRGGRLRALCRLGVLAAGPSRLVTGTAFSLSPKQLRLRAAEREEREKARPKTLRKIGTPLHHAAREPYFGPRTAVDALLALLRGEKGRSVLLVGPSGVGKSAAVRAAVTDPANDLPCYQTSGARLVAGMSGFGMWQELCRRVWEEAAEQGVALYLGNLFELMNVGQSEHNQVGVAGFLRPWLTRNRVSCIAECTAEQFAAAERLDPALVGAFARLDVDEPSAADARAILTEAVTRFNADRDVSPAVVPLIDRLHRRYATYSAFPGRPLRFLATLMARGSTGAEARPPVTPAEVYDAFAAQTGLPVTLIDPERRLDLDETRARFGSRVIGQAEAVAEVVHLLATVKAGLSRADRPLASLLFVGPTGVGKTELAKTLAAFLFGSESRLTRFDMSEYNSPSAVRRLVGTCASEGLLTAKVREEPFSVLLFDEFEKADPSFADLLLQALGEARLTDAAGRLADFRNCVVILTSNLGAETFQAGGYGFAGAGLLSPREHFERAVQQSVRPELFNRLDRVVPFLPLPREVVRAIAAREWSLAARREGFAARELSPSLSEAWLDRLADIGFDPRYGARPLKRALEREVLVPLAGRLNAHARSQPVALRAESLEVTALERRRRPDAERPEAVADAAVDARRAAQGALDSEAVGDMRNQFARLRADRKVRVWLRTGEARSTLLVADYQRLAAELTLADELRADAERLEDAALEAVYGGGSPVTPDAVLEMRRRVRAYRLRLARSQEPNADKITLTLFAEDRAWLRDLAAAYVADAMSVGYGISAWAYRLREAAGRTVKAEVERKWVWESPPVGKPDHALVETPTGRRWLLRRALQKPSESIPKQDEEVVGFALSLEGHGARFRYIDEMGLHKRRAEGGGPKPSPCRVDVSALTGGDTVPPEGVTRRKALEEGRRRRLYQCVEQLIEDDSLGDRFPWRPAVLGLAFSDLIDAQMDRVIAEVLA